MKKSEFLAQLRKALENELDAQSVKENLEYYEDYIQSEVAKGQSEEDVLEHLGDPWAIAKTILLSKQIGGQESHQGAESEREQRKENQVQNISVANWKVWLIIAVVIVVLLSVISAVFGILAVFVRLAIRYAVPILLVILIIKLFKKK